MRRPSAGARFQRAISLAPLALGCTNTPLPPGDTDSSAARPVDAASPCGPIGTWLVTATTCAALLVGLTASAAPTVTLRGRVNATSGRYAVHVALWDEAGFLTRPARELTFAPGAEPSFQLEVPRGRWAISAFEDRNGNGVLDMGLFGPKEPSGFWRPFHAWRKPRFDDVASAVERTVDNADVTLK